MELQQALKVVLRAGYHVEKRGVHLYPSQGQWALLKFDNDANVDAAVDERVGDLDLAIAKHTVLTAPPGSTTPGETVKTAWGDVAVPQ